MIFRLKKHVAEMFIMMVARAARFEENKFFFFEEEVEDMEEAEHRKQKLEEREMEAVRKAAASFHREVRSSGVCPKNYRFHQRGAI